MVGVGWREVCGVGGRGGVWGEGEGGGERAQMSHFDMKCSENKTFSFANLFSISVSL